MLLYSTRFFRSSDLGGVLLLICVTASLIIANSKFNLAFENLLSLKVGVQVNDPDARFSVLQWINDGLMTFFFLLIGLEIKRELIEGRLSSFKKASLPFFAAVGGATVPAVIFWIFNHGSPSANGWGIPMATDIAFALGILSLLGKRVPSSLKVFLAALAIVDDLIAILIIALFYSTGFKIDYLLYAALLFGIMILLNRLRVQNILFYLIPGVLLWYCIHHSGIHATIAGVLTATAIPISSSEGKSPLKKLEQTLIKPVNFLIIPLFVLANSNIRFEPGMIRHLELESKFFILIASSLSAVSGCFLFVGMRQRKNNI
jgi:NhaA family Na+:H+ antiporter